MKKITLLLILLAFVSEAWSQAKTRRLSSIINHPSLNVSSPYLSFDGNAILYVADNGQDGALTVMYSSRESDWKEPIELPKHLNARLNFFRGYALSADGKRMYYTGAKSPTVGGYDIFSADLNGNTWGQPVNLMTPINSKTNDGCPSLTPDGNTMYFMRCDKMDMTKADGCKLFRATKKSNGQWDEPVELPASINTGNSQTPRIMADGETLIFSSNKLSPGKGGMDLYETRLKNGQWTTPVALDFVNSEKDDQYISVAALGRYLLKEAPGSRKNMEITEFLIPNEVRPRGMMMVEGKVTNGAGAATPAYVTVLDVATKKTFYNGRPDASGTYAFYLPEGTRYELSIDPEQSNATFFSRTFDLTSDKIPQKEKVNAILKQPQSGDELLLNVAFKPNSSVLETSSESDLKRLARLAKANSALKFEIQVLMSGYVEDSVKSSPDLTENISESFPSKINAIDSAGHTYAKDTVFVRNTYHNNRTQAQAQAIVTYLVSQGTDAKSYKIFGNAIPATTPENRKTTVKAVAR